MAETRSRPWDTSPTWAPAASTCWRNLLSAVDGTFHTPMAPTLRGSSRRPAFSICWRHYTPTKPRAAGKLERDEFSFEPSASDAAVRTHDIHCVWLPEPAPPARAREVYCVVVAAFSAVWHRDRLGHVFFFALGMFSAAGRGNTASCKIDSNFPQVLRKFSPPGRGSSVVEQPIRNR